MTVAVLLVALRFNLDDNGKVLVENLPVALFGNLSTFPALLMVSRHCEVVGL